MPPPNPTPPPSYWATLISLASLVVAAIGLVTSTGKADREESRRAEQRLCRIEAALGKGDCGK